MRMDLGGKVIIVSGGGKGVGRHASRALAALGARVVVAEQQRQAGETTRRTIVEAGGDAIAVPGDITQTSNVVTILEEALGWAGRIDALVNCVYMLSRQRAITRSTASDFDRVMMMNVRGPFLSMREYVRGLHEREQRGRIVNLAPLADPDQALELSAYAASQAAVVSLTQSVARDHAAAGITANAVCPYLSVLRDDGEAAPPAADAWPDWTAPPKAPALWPLDTRQAVVRALAFLASDAAGPVTGIAFGADGAPLS